MAQRIPRDESLSRVHGVGSLFSAAYGNVGSSIYYALGLTAVYALGLTPLVFIVAGLIFACTAATYTEATTMYPEAGGSSSFARRAFNEFWSFFAAWGQMLNYVVTVAISAFFVPHYLSVFWGPLRENPWDIVGGAVVIILLVALNVVACEVPSRITVKVRATPSVQARIRRPVITPSNSGVAQYLDCAGIRSAAKQRVPDSKIPYLARS